jgi:hypothetical protein
MTMAFLTALHKKYIQSALFTEGYDTQRKVFRKQVMTNIVLQKNTLL